MTMVRPKNKSSETESVNCQIDRLVWVTPALLGHPKLPTLLSQIEVDTGIDLPIVTNFVSVISCRVTPMLSRSVD